ncbi:MAG: universal stress protein [Chloroflexi bacterium]|jgi:nucleotide-binding universal stress UspA family protein|nr:universal stress protein [Chloroflexota bacterium]
MSVHPTEQHATSLTPAGARFRKILVGFDGSAGARRALAQALRLATSDGATVHVLTVIEHLPRYAATVSEMDDALAEAERQVALLQAEARRAADLARVPIESVRRAGHPAKTLVDYAREGGFDLLVLGHAGHSSVWGSFLGTTCDKVVRHAPCSVLIVR